MGAIAVVTGGMLVFSNYEALTEEGRQAARRREHEKWERFKEEKKRHKEAHKAHHKAEQHG